MIKMVDELYIELAKCFETYDLVRVVDPYRKRSYSFSRKEREILDILPCNCYDHWKKEGHCINCISSRAIINNKSYAKLENIEQRVFLIISSPIKLQKRELAIECLMDVTDDGVFTYENLDVQMITEIIAGRNFKVVKDSKTCFISEDCMQERLTGDLIRAKEEKQTVGIVLINVNNLFEINKFNGYKVYQELFSIIDMKVKPYNGWASKLSENEFLLVLNNIGKTSLDVYSEELRSSITKNEMFSSNGQSNVRLCFETKIIRNETPEIDEMIEALRVNLRARRIMLLLDEHVASSECLTLREIDVALLLLKGRKNSQVSDELNIGLSTRPFQNSCKPPEWCKIKIP